MSGAGSLSQSPPAQASAAGAATTLSAAPKRRRRMIASGSSLWRVKMLAASDEDLGPGDIGGPLAAQVEDGRRDVLGRAEPVQRDARDQRLGFGRQHGGADLAGRHAVDADALWAELGGELARQRRERRLGGRT